jgi:putative heme-binding domain-containing protein
MKQILPARGGIGEHGPHAILTGLDGFQYFLYGNHSAPDVEYEYGSPLRGMREDVLLPRYTDPNGHAAHVRVPAGVINRLNLETGEWESISGGFRNAYDMDMDAEGEILTYDSDMEWDVGLPWFRPTRVIHAVPGGDYGWRTGSSKLPGSYPDTLPAVYDVGRGSPVGVTYYYHHVYPELYFGAYFHSDWSRGRIRVMFPRKNGATFEGTSLDFVVGEPLNVTDVAVGPDGYLYFSCGGRGTTGALYRVVWKGGLEEPAFGTPLKKILNQPMPRSAWGQSAIHAFKESMQEDWAEALHGAIFDSTRYSTNERIRALEYLQIHGPKPGPVLLAELIQDDDPAIRSVVCFLLGTHSFAEARSLLTGALDDLDPQVIRRACEALVRSGLDNDSRIDSEDPLPQVLFELLQHPDRFVRYAARNALIRVDTRVWVPAVFRDDVGARGAGAVESLLAAIQAQVYVGESDNIFAKVEEYSRADLSEELLLPFCRVVQLAFLRDLAPSEPGRQALKQRLGVRFLERFPTGNPALDRELQILLAYLNPPGAIEELLEYLSPERSQEDQIHTVYCLRTVQKGWTRKERQQLIDWFGHAWEFGGANSMAGFINNLWADSLKLLEDGERKEAEARKQAFFEKRAQEVAELLASVEGAPTPGESNLSQMSFQELSEYLEYDTGAYPYGGRKKQAERGELIFMRSKCVDCHRFGDIGKGTGPDLSTVVQRFRRREILEAIVSPSKTVSDQYQSVNVRTKDGEVLSGFVAEDDKEKLELINVSGERIEIAQENIDSREPSQVSMMPEGLIHTMSLGDLVDLFIFLEEGTRK